MKNIITAALLVACPTLAFAAPVADYAKPSKEGFVVYGGVSTITGDLEKALDDNNAFSIGVDYTTHDGAIIGMYFMPELFSESYSSGQYSGELDASSLGIYTGYQTDSNLRFTGGLAITSAEVVISNGYRSVSNDETTVGFTAGVEYQFDHIMIGGRLATYEVGDVDGQTLTINVGYKFK